MAIESASEFVQAMSTAYATKGAALDLGRGVHDGRSSARRPCGSR